MSKTAGYFGLASATVVLMLVAVAIPWHKWQNKDGSISKYVDYNIDVGLWKFCNVTKRTVYSQSGIDIEISEELLSECLDLVDVYSPDEIGLVTIATCCLFACLGCMVLAMIGAVVKLYKLNEWKHEKQQMALGFITAFLAFSAGILDIVAFGIYDAKLKFDGYRLEAAFYLTVIAWLFSWLAAGLLLADGICTGAKLYPP